MNMLSLNADRPIRSLLPRDERAEGRSENAATIKTRIGCILVDRLPALAMQIVGKGKRRWLDGLAVVTEAFEIVRSRSAAGKVNPMLSLRRASRNTEMRRSRMRRQLAPL